jgi:hypothetical protein
MKNIADKRAEFLYFCITNDFIHFWVRQTNNSYYFNINLRPFLLLDTESKGLIPVFFGSVTRQPRAFCGVQA